MPVDFLKLLESLADTGLEFVIVGGVAARLYGSPRVTHDVDIVPRLDRDSWQRAVDMLWSKGARPRIPERLETVRDLSEVRKWISDKGMLALTFRSPDGSSEVDLLVGEADRFDHLRSHATRVQLGTRVFFVAHIDDLIAMKELAGRPQDRLDIEALQKIKSGSE
jgi:predicted nucleotidyltransferase